MELRELAADPEQWQRKIQNADIFIQSLFKLFCSDDRLMFWGFKKTLCFEIVSVAPSFITENNID